VEDQAVDKESTMPRASNRAPNMALRDKGGQPYIGGIEAWHSGIDGLFITRVPEEPHVFTVTHHSGLRVGMSRFPDVKSACKVVHDVFGDKLDFTAKARELRKDARFGLLMKRFIAYAQQVGKSMANVTRNDLVADLEEGGTSGVDRPSSPGPSPLPL